MVFSVYTDETETNDRSLSVFKYSQKVSIVYTGKILYEKNLICTRKNMYVHKECWFGTYTVREAHWFKSSFTGNNAPFNTNGIQCIYR